MFNAEWWKDIEHKWFVDSCASKQMTNNRHIMEEYRKLNETEEIDSAASIASVSFIGVGNVRLKQIVNSSPKKSSF